MTAHVPGRCTGGAEEPRVPWSRDDAPTLDQGVALRMLLVGPIERRLVREGRQQRLAHRWRGHDGTPVSALTLTALLLRGWSRHTTPDRVEKTRLGTEAARRAPTEEIQHDDADAAPTTAG